MDGGVINKFRTFDQSIYVDYPLWDIEIKQHFSVDLAFMLNFGKEVAMKQTMSLTMIALEYSVINGQYILDKSVGLNFMFVDCDKIGNTTVGFECRRTLLIRPLKWYNSRDNHMIETYSIVKESLFLE